MPVNPPSLADPEIAAATFANHLKALWATGRPQRLGWQLLGPSVAQPLQAIVTLPARAASAPDVIDYYHVRLGAQYYDAGPPSVAIVEPEVWTPATDKSRWFPKLQAPGWFGLHSAYGYPDGSKRQLVCFTFAAEYYMTDHAPKESEKWQQGRHTVAATLYRLAEVFAPPYYLGRSA